MTPVVSFRNHSVGARAGTNRTMNSPMVPWRSPHFDGLPWSWTRFRRNTSRPRRTQPW